MLVFPSQSEIWIAQNFNFTVFEDVCLSLSWKYRFLQNVNHAKSNPKPTSIANFTLIRKDEVCLEPILKVRYGPKKNCIETP